MKVPGGFKVYDTDGRIYSRHPLTKYMARRQQSALYAAEAQKGIKYGKGYMVIHHDGKKHKLLEGQGFFSDIFSSAKKAISSAVGAVKQRFTDVAQGIRKDYPPDVRRVIAKYGDQPITKIVIHREPIQSFITKALNFITLGKWEEVRGSLPYDKLFHLRMYVSLADGTRLICEKNQVINIKPVSETAGVGESMDVPLNKQLTLKQFLDAGAQRAGDAFFLYDAFTNNCQMFVDGLLTANGLNNPQLQAFVKQDVQQLADKLPGYVGKIARGATDLAALADVALKGRAVRMEAKGGAATREWFNKQKALGRLKQYSTFEDMIGQQKAAAADAATRTKQYAAEASAKLAETPPGEELVACKVKDDLSLGRNVVPKSKCKELHDARFAKWEAETHPDRAKFFRPLVEGIKTAVELGLENIPGVPDAMKEIHSKVVKPLLGEGKIKTTRIRAAFKKQLEEMGLKPATYLRAVRRAAKKAGYDAATVQFADDAEHKLMIHVDGRKEKFGRVGYGDFIIWKHLEKTGEAEKGMAAQKRRVFHKSHKAIPGDWKADKFSPNSLALAILWT